MFARFGRTALLSFFAALALTPLAHAEQILMVGDSLTCGSFGARVIENARPNELIQYCTISSAPVHWMEGRNPAKQFVCQTRSTADATLKKCGAHPTFASLLARYPNARVVVALGTNSLANPRPDRHYADMIALLKNGKRKCDWITPPHLNPPQAAAGFSPARITGLENNLSTFTDSLTTMIGTTCEVIDSRDATAVGSVGNQTVDGIHRRTSAGNYWADQLRSRIFPAPAGRANAPAARSSAQ